jgi:hypothetical protein
VSSRRRPSTTSLFVGATTLGLVGGWLLARQWDSSHRRDLFSPRVHRRVAALGWLESELDPATLPLLQDYLAWEPKPALQARGRRLATRLGLATS